MLHPDTLPPPPLRLFIAMAAILVVTYFSSIQRSPEKEVASYQQAAFDRAEMIHRQAMGRQWLEDHKQ